VVLGDGLVPLLLANTLYGGAGAWYWYITHLGYRALPFLAHTELFLFPIAIITLVYVILVILYPFGYGINAAQFMAKFYFL
jgi:UNC-50 family